MDDDNQKKKRRKRRREGFWWCCCCGFWVFVLTIGITIPIVVVTTQTVARRNINPYFNNKVYVAYDTNANRRFNPLLTPPNYALYTTLGLMDFTTGVIEYVAPITIDWGIPYNCSTRNIIMGPDNQLYGCSQWIFTPANAFPDRFIKINTTTGATQVICPFIGAFFPYRTSSLLITKNSLVYFKSGGVPSYVQLLNISSCTLTNVGVPFNSTNGVEYNGRLYFTFNNQLIYMTLPDHTIYYDGYYDLPYNVTLPTMPTFCTQDRCSAPSGLFPYVDGYGTTSLRTLFLPDPRDTEYFVEFNFNTNTLNYVLNRTLNGNNQIVYDCANTYYYDITMPPAPPIAKKKKDFETMNSLYVIAQGLTYVFLYDPNTMTVTPLENTGHAIDKLFKSQSLLYIQSGNGIYSTQGSSVCSGISEKVIGSGSDGGVYTISETSLHKLHLNNCSSELINNNLSHNCVNVSAVFQDSIYCITPQNEFVSLLDNTVIGTIPLQEFNNQLFVYQGELIFFYNANIFKRINVTNGDFIYPDLQISFMFGLQTTIWELMQY